MSRKKKPVDEPKEASFEESMARLETIVEELERGEIGLEPSLELFEEGVSLARRLERRLQSAEMTVEKLARGSHVDGDDGTVPLDVADLEEDEAP